MASLDDCIIFLCMISCGVFFIGVAIAFVITTSPIWIPYSMYSKLRYGKWWFFDCVKEWSCVKDCISPQASSTSTPPVSTKLPSLPPPVKDAPEPSTDRYVVTVETVSQNKLDQESTKMKLKKAVEVAFQEKSLQNQ